MWRLALLLGLAAATPAADDVLGSVSIEVGETVEIEVGYAIGVGFMMAIGVNWGWLVWIIGIVLAIVLIVVTFRFNLQKWVIIAATS